MSKSPTRPQFPGTTHEIPSSPNQIGSNLKGEFYAAGGLLRQLSTEEIFDSDRMQGTLTELKRKSTGELRKQLVMAGATIQQLDEIDDMRPAKRKAALIKAIVPLAREQNKVFLHLVLQPPSLLRMHREALGIGRAELTDMLYSDDT